MPYLALRAHALSHLPTHLRPDEATCHVDLGFNRFTSLPSVGELWPNLQILWLHNNRLCAPITGFDRLHGLRELDLSYNQLEVLPESIGELSSLEVLNLQGNRLRRLPHSLGRLKSLRRLNLYQNQLESLPDSLGALSALEHLDASSNQLSALPDSMGNCSALSWLVFSENRLTALPDGLARLTNLQRAFFTSNQLTTLPPAPDHGAALLDVTGNAFALGWCAAYPAGPAPRWRLLCTDKP